MALVYTAQASKEWHSQKKVPAYHIFDTPLAPAPSLVEAKTLTYTQQREAYREWLTLHSYDQAHDLMKEKQFVLLGLGAKASIDWRGWAVEWLSDMALVESLPFRYGGEIVDGKVNRLIVSGSREMSVGLYNQAVNTIWPYIKSGYRLVVGDAAGIDATAQHQAMRLSSIMEIWFPKSLGFRNVPPDVTMWLPKPTYHPVQEAATQYVHRTKEMVLSGDPDWNHDVFLAFWNGTSRGTKHAIEQAKKMQYASGAVYVDLGDKVEMYGFLNDPDLEAKLKEK